MKRKLFLVAAIILVTSAVSGQNEKKYDKLTHEARELRKKEKFLESAKKYSDAFIALGNTGIWYDRYNAACSWALAGVPDSAFSQLFTLAKNAGFSDMKSLSTDADFTSLRQDPRWNELLGIVNTNKEKAEAGFDKELMAILDTVYQEDQKYRHQIDEVEQQYGYESDEMKKLWVTIREKDSINQLIVTRILDERGWLGADVIGQQGNMTLFIVIQHADLTTQEKYLPMMREAVKKGDAFAGNLALLEDRVALAQGKKQIYGSQIGRNEATGDFYVLPLEDPGNVNKRRTEVGLGKIEDYVSIFGIKWSVKNYHKQLLEVEKNEKPR